VKVINQAAHLLTKEELVDWMVDGEKLALGVGGGTRKDEKKNPLIDE